MALSLMSKRCGDPCKEEREFKITVEVNSLEMTDENEDELFENVMVVICWGKHVLRMTKTSGEPEEFQETKDILIRSSPLNLMKRLKSNPIFITLSRGCDDLGTVELEIPNCFAEAVTCSDFNSQALSNDIKFEEDEERNGKMSIVFRIASLPLNETTKKVFKTIQKQSEKQEIYRKIQSGKATGAGGDKYDQGVIDGFQCPDEIPENMQESLKLNQNFYRIINGNLVNVKEDAKICGEKSQPTRKIVKDLCQQTPAKLPSLNRIQFADKQPSCANLFRGSKHTSKVDVKCPDCGGQKSQTKFPMSDIKKLQTYDLINRNIEEEDLLRNLCKKYGIDVDEVRTFGEKIEEEKEKKIKKRKGKKPKKVIKLPPSLILEEKEYGFFQFYHLILLQLLKFQQTNFNCS